ncbi:uncharacterized protein [Littorina saxatilis]|uniref:Uncharacterized protein n=1 Tax=Littorina saxatilis TaxID=31220 RepID=A0AAN9ASR9_9CAEN
MSSLTLLTATVVVLGLWCWVPTGGVNNPRMLQCNMTTMPVVALNTPHLLEGRWYMSHHTIVQGERYKYNGKIHDVKLSIPLARDANGQEKRNFLAITTTETTPTSNHCIKEHCLDQIIGNKFSSDYRISTAGYIYYFNTYVLATDYVSTSVIFTEMIFNAHRNITRAVIKVMVRDPAIPPDADVVDAALNGFCKGDFLDLSSDYYAQIPNNNNLKCFAAPSLTT